MLRCSGSRLRRSGHALPRLRRASSELLPQVVAAAAVLQQRLQWLTQSLPHWSSPGAPLSPQLANTSPASWRTPLWRWCTSQ